jgi:hypothetical protein
MTMTPAMSRTPSVRDLLRLIRKFCVNYERAHSVAALPIIMRYGG